MSNAIATALRVVLILSGVFIVFTGLNTALGGMLTLGWQGQPVFFEVINEHTYLVQDSHIRFTGGIWVGVGVIFFLGATNLSRYQSQLNFAFALIFLGGLMRFSQMHIDITLGQDIIGSLIAELIGMPLLYFWLSKTDKQIK